jgi:hypothetical protein
MNDPEAIKRLVQHAREQATRDHEAQQVEADVDRAALSRVKEAAARLLETLPGQLAAICMQSSGAMHWAGEAMSEEGAEYKLTWLDPPPERILSILVEADGLVLWGSRRRRYDNIVWPHAAQHVGARLSHLPVLLMSSCMSTAGPWLQSL